MKSKLSDNKQTLLSPSAGGQAVRKGEIMNINNLVEIFHESVSNFLKPNDDYDEVYYMGRAHAFILVFSIFYKQKLIDGDTLSQLNREWDEAFKGKYIIDGKE